MLRSASSRERPPDTESANELAAEAWRTTRTGAGIMRVVHRDGVPAIRSCAPARAAQAPAPAATCNRPGFRPGDVLANRFRIVRLLGRGGMGEVYEAYDGELRVDVALKTSRPEILGEAEVVERFRREILLARRVTHPNVCRVFDVFVHRVAPTDVAAPFVTMELLDGETLAARLLRSGRLPTSEAVPIVAQIAAGLSAAHRSGIVHRDLKSANVMLVPSEGGSVRAAVMDFGFARTLAESDVSLSGSGAWIGTSAYMAPEQVEGGDVTVSADIYALGVVMYEIVTGHRPFAGDSPLAIAVKRLHGPPPSPRIRVPDLDPRWERAILRCLERTPGDRFSRSEDVVRALVGEGLPPLPRPAGRRSVAVLGLENLCGRRDRAWLGSALPVMLRTELAAGGLRVIPAESTARMMRDLALRDADSLATETLLRIHESLGADLVVVGSYLAAAGRGGGRIRLDLRIQDARAGETIAAEAAVGTEADLIDLVSKAGALLRRRLWQSKPPPALSDEAVGRRRARPGIRGPCSGRRP
jgi:eukaryotic-like serine/threonine-protein kinase